MNCPKCGREATHYCKLIPESPHWHCDNCGHRWYSEKVKSKSNFDDGDLYDAPFKKEVEKP